VDLQKAKQLKQTVRMDIDTLTKRGIPIPYLIAVRDVRLV